jgi:hypothetical protein
MGHDDDGRASVEEVAKRGERRPDAAIVGNLAVGEGDVQIGPYQDPFSFDGKLIEGQGGHR